MGRRGPKPKPTPVLKLHGSRWPERRNGNEPPILEGRPRCPKWIAPSAKRAWKRLIPQLEAMGVLSLTDQHALIVLCQTWARWREAEEFLQQHGTTYPTKDEQGRVTGFRRFPQVGIAETASSALNRWFAEFGLTPSARSRISVPPPARNPNDPFFGRESPFFKGSAG